MHAISVLKSTKIEYRNNGLWISANIGFEAMLSGLVTIWFCTTKVPKTSKLSHKAQNSAKLIIGNKGENIGWIYRNVIPISKNWNFPELL